jgi:hypothetical protein
MGSFSNYAENKVLDHVLKKTAFTVPSNLWIALSTADPTDTGSSIAEPSGNGYQRVLQNSWTTASSRANSNNGDITFPQASGAWGTISHWGIFDASSGGNMIAHGSFSVSKSVVSGNIPKINSGDLDISFNSGGVTTTLANKILDHVFKVTSMNQADSLWVALATSSPGDAGSQSGEPAGNNYARVNVNAWNAAASGATANTSDVTFNTASGSWGTIAHTFIVPDATSGGTTWLYAAVDSSQAVEANDIPKFPAGDIDITLD